MRLSARTIRFACSSEQSTNVTAISDQRQKSVEHLGGERHGLSFSQKNALSFVDAKLAEFVEMLGPLDHTRPHNFLRTS